MTCKNNFLCVWGGKYLILVVYKLLGPLWSSSSEMFPREWKTCWRSSGAPGAAPLLTASSCFCFRLPGEIWNGVMMPKQTFKTFILGVTFYSHNCLSAEKTKQKKLHFSRLSDNLALYEPHQKSFRGFPLRLFRQTQYKWRTYSNSLLLLVLAALQQLKLEDSLGS